MNTSNIQRAIADTEKLRDSISRYATRGVAGWVHSFNLLRANDPDHEPRLHSPDRECAFLLGILLSTPEPQEGISLDQEGWMEAISLVDTIFNTYALAFFPTPTEGEARSPSWRTVHEVAVPAFLRFFFSGMNGLLASGEQILERVRAYVSPFDAEIHDAFGLTATEAVEVVEEIMSAGQRALDRAQDLSRGQNRLRQQLFGRASKEQWSDERLESEFRRSNYLKVSMGLREQLDMVLEVRLSDLFNSHGDRVSRAFWKLFTCRRGDGARFTYLTDANLLDQRPLILAADDVALCPQPAALYSSVLTSFETYLLGGRSRQTFLKHRDATLEANVEKQLQRLLGPRWKAFRRCFETPAGQFEHDLILTDGSRCLVIESKASPPLEPFRDPERAFERLKRHFSSDRGIQKAYEQGRRIWDSWNSGTDVQLFDEDGKEIATLRATRITELFVVCATRDNFGAMAVNLNPLLDKRPSDPYPWAINVLDLESIADAWQYLKWGPERLFDFLRDRIKLPGKLGTTDDELDVVGYFIRHGSLSYLLAGPDKVVFQLDPTYSHVFDEIYQATRQGGPPVIYDPKPPVTTDMKASLAADHPILVNPVSGAQRRMKIGRNEPCPCGSGKKFKRCHGQPT